MSYTIIVETHCQKALRKIAQSDRTLLRQFDEHILALAHNPYPPDVVILRHTEQYDLCRTKVGRKWRLLYGVVAGKLIILILDAVACEAAYENLDVLAIRLERELAELDDESSVTA